MNTYPEKYGFVYIWFDRKHKRYYVGSHWGSENDGYICSSRHMRRSFHRRPDDFKRRTLKKIYTSRKDLLVEEERWLKMIDPMKTMTKNTTTESRQKNVRYYNIYVGGQNQWWASEDSRLTVGEKISAKKKGKTTGPCSPEKAKAISEAKKKKFAERGGMSDEHRAAITGIKKKPHTDEWKAANSARMKEQWSNGSRKRAEPKQTMTREQQDQLSSEGLQARWADSEWKARQSEALKAAWARRKLNKAETQSPNV